MGPKRAMGDQAPVGPPEEAEGSPPPQRIGAGVQIGGQPQATAPAAGCGDPCGSPSQHQSNSNPERQAQDPDALVVAATRCQAFGVFGRPQADALGQNLPGGAISSAVEHLPYKEIVTGSIPVSPTSSTANFFSCANVFQGSVGRHRETLHCLGHGLFVMVINHFSRWRSCDRPIRARVCRLCLCSL